MRIFIDAGQYLISQLCGYHDMLIDINLNSENFRFTLIFFMSLINTSQIFLVNVLDRLYSQLLHRVLVKLYLKHFVFNNLKYIEAQKALLQNIYYSSLFTLGKNTLTCFNTKAQNETEERKETEERMRLFLDVKRQNCFSWKNSRFVYNGKMVKKFLVHKMRVRPARTISMLECKHYTQT